MENNTDFEKAFGMLRKTELSLSSILFIKKAFLEEGAKNNPNIETLSSIVQRGEPPLIRYKNKTTRINYSFDTYEEAELLGVLKKIAPEEDEEKLVKVIEIVNTLLGKESAYTF